MAILKGPKCHTSTEDCTREHPAPQSQDPPIPVMGLAVAEVHNIRCLEVMGCPVAHLIGRVPLGTKAESLPRWPRFDQMPIQKKNYIITCVEVMRKTVALCDTSLILEPVSYCLIWGGTE